MDDVPLPLGLPELTSSEDEYPVHPAAEAFRMHSEEELETLVASIAANGLFDPIMFDADGDLLVDGRNRLKACRRAGVEPSFERLPPGVDPVEYIVAHNIARRDLTKGQKALALALIYPEGKKGRGNIDPATKSADSADFSMRRLRDARQIVRHPDLVDMVRSGAKPFDQALSEATRRQQTATSEEVQLARLQTEAPDVAALVVEGTLTLAAGLKELDERARNKRVAIEQGQDAAADIVPTFVAHVAAIVAARELGENITLDTDEKKQLRAAFMVLRREKVV
jgi:hypothetical protein